MAEPPSPSAPPPHYAAATSSYAAPSVDTNLDTFFDIVPQADQTSFQIGYLGLEGFRAWIKGDVLVKLDERARSEPTGYSRCSISLYAIESDQDQSITIFSEKQVLWTSDAQPPSSSTSRQTGEPSYATLPSTLPFSFPLTSDLPHCLHLPSSSLEYRLEATLKSIDPSVLPDAFRSTKVHLTRYSRPGPLQSIEEPGTVEPYTWNISSPTSMIVQLQRRLYRRAEPICVFVRIPPPERKLLSISLRSVEANLLRIITVKRTESKHELLLAHSGKLCRFHSTRAIVLRLQLHPPFDVSNMPYPHPDHDAAQGGPIYGRGGGGGCESISQETLLHDVKFLVRINIAIRSDEGERKDVTLEHEVTILPGAAGNVDVASDERMGPVQGGEEATAKWVPASPTGAGPSTSTASQPVIDDFEEEYDGYEDVGRSLSDTEEHHGSIEDVDEPPPTLLESQNDVQVEVEVEGVGAGVLREADQTTPSIPGDYVWRTGEESVPPPEDDDLPPPPLSPPVMLPQSVEETNLNPAHASIVGPSSTYDQSADIARHHPPPYMASSMRIPRSVADIPVGDLAAAEELSLHQPSAVLTDPSHPSPPEEGFPPAYTHPPPSPFTPGQHPPSYEA